MSKSCARCEKTVYPIEELKCLDKVRIENKWRYIAIQPFYVSYNFRDTE